MTPLLVSMSQLTKMVGLSRPTIYQMEKDGNFPKRRQMTQGRVAWLYSEVEAWANSLSNSDSQTNSASRFSSSY